MKTLFILLFMTTATALSQSLPYSSITAPGESFSAGTVAARMIDGLGFRYFWATEGLRESDLAVKKPGTGLPASRLPELLGRRLARPVAADVPLSEADLES